MLRIVVTGGPVTGKTTFARKLADRVPAPLLSTDDLSAVYDWSETSERASAWFDLPAPWIVEGVAAGRALRKWLARNPVGQPADIVLLMNDPMMERTRGQQSMAKGCDTIWRGIEEDMESRGVVIYPLSAPVTEELDLWPRSNTRNQLPQ